MKNLIKNEICGSVNSAFMHCSQKTGQKLQLLFMYRTWTVPLVGGKVWKEKKKERKRSKRDMDPNSALVMANIVGLVRLQS